MVWSGEVALNRRCFRIHLVDPLSHTWAVSHTRSLAPPPFPFVAEEVASVGGGRTAPKPLVVPAAQQRPAPAQHQHQQQVSFRRDPLCGGCEG
jgi:hypothetical protein